MDTSLDTISSAGLTKIPTLATDADGVFSLTFDTDQTSFSPRTTSTENAESTELP